jgi:hypothetical protein
MSLRGGTTKQSHAIQGGYASVRLPRYARNDMDYCIPQGRNQYIY